MRLTSRWVVVLIGAFLLASTTRPASAYSVQPHAYIHLQYLTGVPDQGNTLSCAAYAADWDISYLYSHRHRTHLLFSPLWLEDWANGGIDAVGDIYQMANAVNAHGMVPWDWAAPHQPAWSSDIHSPWFYPASTIASAYRVQIKVHRLWEGTDPNRDITPAQWAIAHHHPVLIGANVRQSFLWEANTTGSIHAQSGSFLYNHEMLLIGYSNRRHAFLAENWYGQHQGVNREGQTDFVHGGYLWLSYKWVQTAVFDAAYYTLDS